MRVAVKVLTIDGGPPPRPDSDRTRGCEGATNHARRGSLAEDWALGTFGRACRTFSVCAASGARRSTRAAWTRATAALRLHGCGGNLEVVYDYAAIGRAVTRESLAANLDRASGATRRSLPVEHARVAARLNVGGTPLLAALRAGRASSGSSKLWLKDDTRNPSASFKDRAGAIVLADAHERGERVVSGASTGNAASSLACLRCAHGHEDDRSSCPRTRRAPRSRRSCSSART